MAKVRTIYRCTECGTATPKWTGRCSGCGAWNALVEEVDEVRPLTPAPLPPSAAPVPISAVGMADAAPRPTGVPELDRVLGGGLVPGSVTLLGGEPGIGKSTLLLHVAAARAAAGATSLYMTAEESAQQVRGRAERLGTLHDRLYLQVETALPNVLAAIEHLQPEIVVVDSIQTVHDPELGSAPGSVVQVRECAHRLVREAKARGTTVLLVGHVTKDGGLAGPRVLEHVVDTVLEFQGERHHALRLLRATKHRFGPTNELGLFEMVDDGLAAVTDPSQLFLADRSIGVAGSAVVALLEGQRPLLVEVQALVARSPLAVPRRSAQGLDQSRLALLLAVLERRAGLRFSDCDVYVSAVGGVRLAERGTDLAVCLALASALRGEPIPADVVAVGEVGLAGELRQVSQTPRRMAEAARLGFGRALLPASAPNGAHGIKTVRLASLADALHAVGFHTEAPLRLRDVSAPRPALELAHDDW